MGQMGFLLKATKREVRATQISILEVQVEIEIARARRSGRSHAIMQKIGLALLCASAAALTLPKIAVLGRPNVGKSTIANRLTQNFDKGAVVFNEPGVTRDRLYSDGFWRDHEFTVVDTGGIVFDDQPDEVFLKEIRQQALVALSEAKVALLVVDGQAGRTVLDEQIAAFLRKQGTPVVLAVNKCESTVDGELQAADFWSLGLGTPWPVSGYVSSNRKLERILF